MTNSGKLSERVPEGALVIPALFAAAQSPDGEIAMRSLIHMLSRYFVPQGRDAQILTNRCDTYFSQKVRNLVSHRKRRGSIFEKGYLSYDAERRSIRITPEGRDYLALVFHGRALVERSNNEKP